MSNADEYIAQLEQEKRAAQELLFLTVDKFGPVVLNIEESREAMKGDRMIDLNLNEDEGTWTLSVVSIGE